MDFVRSWCLAIALSVPAPLLARTDVAHSPRVARPSRTARATHAEVTPTPWSQFRAPTNSVPQVIGGYSAGCIDGAVPLPLAGEGFRVVHPERNRIFGHPELIDLIAELSLRLRELELPALSIGDLSQPRGGPTPSGHASHQTGLDVDIWFVPPWTGRPFSMVDVKHKRPSPLFDDDIVRLLVLAASDTRVDRIFVNPVLKRALCQRTVDDFDRTWLQKLRPWYGHDDHFHVRVACPIDSPTCIPPSLLPPGDGCDQLASWLRQKTVPVRKKGQPSYFAKAAPAPELPDDCRALLDPAPTRVTPRGALSSSSRVTR
jgi:penicillin-insensitive murein endopeptidase